jgi:hypothetical protein
VLKQATVLKSSRMSQTSFFDADCADRRKPARRDALQAQTGSTHPKAGNESRPYVIKADTVCPSDANHPRDLRTFIACALSNLWIARRWLAWPGEVHL